MMIAQDTVQKILDTARIEEVVGEFVHLKKRGANLLGHCPFHNEKTPSFTVSPAKGIYKCFGCGAAGSSVSFVMEHEQMTYPEALRYLAKKYNIEIEEEERTPEQIAAQNERETMMQLSDFAAQYFQDQLHNTDEGKAIGLSYLQKRGISNEMIQKFQLGYSPDEWTAFTEHALSQAYKIETLEKTGLTIVKSSVKHFDRFKGRVMFPIHSLTGNVIAFGGRTLSQDKKQAKYVNSPESELYHKSKVLYGIAFARHAMVKLDNCFLVEGYTDVISLFDAGVENVVASSGTSLTTEQIRLIKRFTPNVTVLYDGDTAGIKAGLRSIDMILAEGMNVKVVRFPDGEDPDSFARSHSSSEVVDFLQNSAQDFLHFKVGLLNDEEAKDPIQRAKVIKDMVESMAAIPDLIVRQVYVKEAAQWLNMPEQSLQNELNKQLRKKLKAFSSTFNAPNNTSSTELAQPPLQPAVAKQKSRRTKQEENVCRLLLSFGKDSFVHIDEEDNEIELRVSEVIGDFLDIENLEFQDPTCKKVYDLYREQTQDDHYPESSFFVNHPDKEVVKFAVDVFAQDYELSPNWFNKKQIYVKQEADILGQSVKRSLLDFNLSIIETEIEVLSQQLKIEEDTDKAIQLLAEIEKKKLVAKRMCLGLGRTIIK